MPPSLPLQIGGPEGLSFNERAALAAEEKQAQFNKVVRPSSATSRGCLETGSTDQVWDWWTVCINVGNAILLTAHDFPQFVSKTAFRSKRKHRVITCTKSKGISKKREGYNHNMIDGVPKSDLILFQTMFERGTRADLVVS